MTKIFLVRHGEVAGNRGDTPVFVGWSDLPLNERGQEQALQVGAFLEREKIHGVYASDLQRAEKTAERIAEKHGLKVEANAALREVNYGKWEGLSEADLQREYSRQWPARQNDPWNVAAVDGENYAQMWARFFPLWKELRQKHGDENFVLVGHNGLLRMLLCYLTGAPFENFKRFHVANGGVSRVEIKRDEKKRERIILKTMNETAHLVS
jgi:broad specificity phosphatase PhoE